jgi:hypothetical protein
MQPACHEMKQDSDGMIKNLLKIKPWLLFGRMQKANTTFYTMVQKSRHYGISDNSKLFTKGLNEQRRTIECQILKLVSTKL